MYLKTFWSLRIVVIIKNRQSLELSYVPKKVYCRERELDQLTILVEGRGKALISGDIGTGKTLLARYFSKGNVYVNCFINKSEHAILETILSQVKPRFNPAGMPSRKLWDQLDSEKTIILDEVEGIILDDLNHFLYTLSRLSEQGRKLRYIAITRDAFLLRHMINDDATWSTFAEKAVVHLKPYTHDQISEILKHRVDEAFYPKTIDEETISLIADISLISPGHMRTAMDILRNSALIAEKKGFDVVTPETVREANLDTFVDGLNLFPEDKLFALLPVAVVCKRKAYATVEEILDVYRVRCENQGLKPDENQFMRNLDYLEKQGMVHRRGDAYTILYSPASLLVEEIEKNLKQL